MKSVFCALMLILPCVAFSQEDAPQVVDYMPYYIGGMNRMHEYIYDNLKMPACADVPGTIIVQFKVDTLGNTVDPKIVRGIGEDCPVDEALRKVILSMNDGGPRWVAGRNSTGKVTVTYNLPIRWQP